MSGSRPDHWNLAQWAADVRAFCDALEIEKPIVLGVSFGGMVAMKYAASYPDHPSRLILVSTVAIMAIRPDAESPLNAWEAWKHAR